MISPLEDFASRNPLWAPLVHVATKTVSEKEEEEDERLVRKSPPKKPPRRDLERGRVQDEEDKDSDKSQDEKDRSKNYKDAVRRALARYAKVSPTPSGKFKAERPMSEIPRYFDTEEEAQQWVEGENGGGKEEDSKKKLKKKDPKPKDERSPEEKAQEKEDQLSAFMRNLPEDLDPEWDLKGKFADYSDAQRSAFSSAFKKGRRELAQFNPKGSLTKFAEDVKKARSDLDSGALTDPAKLAEALAKIEFYTKVVDNPFVETDPEIGPIPKSTRKPKDAVKAKARAADRAFAAVDKYRELTADDRNRHAQRLREEIETLSEGSERRLHLEGIEKGIAVASALEAGDEAEGINPSILNLTQIAARTGNLRPLMELGSLESKEILGSTDQDVLRKVYGDLDDSEWVEVLGEDHPGRALADLLADSKGLSPDDIAFVRANLQDLMVAEATFIDPYAARELPESSARKKGKKAKAARAKVVPELSFPELGDDVKGLGGTRTKTIKSWVQGALKAMAGVLSGKSPDEKKEDHGPGDVWKTESGWSAKSTGGESETFDSQEEAATFSKKASPTLWDAAEVDLAKLNALYAKVVARKPSTESYLKFLRLARKSLGLLVWVQKTNSAEGSSRFSKVSREAGRLLKEGASESQLREGVESFLQVVRGLLDGLAPVRFTYRGFKVLNEERISKDLAEIALGGIDFLRAKFLKRGIVNLLEEGLSRIRLTVDPGPQGYLDSWTREMVISVAELAKGSPRFGVTVAGELVIHEFGHLVHVNLLSHEAKKFWDAPWYGVSDLSNPASRFDAHNPKRNETLAPLEIPTEYGRTNEREDFAETFLLFVASPERLTQTARFRMMRALSLSGLYGKPILEASIKYDFRPWGRISTPVR